MTEVTGRDEVGTLTVPGREATCSLVDNENPFISFLINFKHNKVVNSKSFICVAVDPGSSDVISYHGKEAGREIREITVGRSTLLLTTD